MRIGTEITGFASGGTVVTHFRGEDRRSHDGSLRCPVCDTEEKLREAESNFGSAFDDYWKEKVRKP